MPREEILKIASYCQEHKITYKERLDELKIPYWTFYKAKRKYRLQDEASPESRGEFKQLTPGTFSPGAMPVRSNRSKRPSGSGTSCQESYLTIELRTSSGTAMRIQGNMTPAHLRELIYGGNV